MTQIPVQEQLKALEQLQEIDLKIDALKQKKAAFPLALRELEVSLAQARREYEETQKTFEEIAKLERQTKAAIELNTERLNRANEKLTSVANTQEFNAANKEIDQLKKMNGQLEEQLKTNEAKIAEANTQIGAKEESVNQAQAALDAKNQEFSGQVTQLDQEISKVEQERTPYTSKVEKRILSLYQRIRPARMGLGIVPAIGGRCKGCNMTLPPQLFNEVQRAASFHQCPSCNRLIFAPGAEENEEKTNSQAREASV